MMNKKELFDLCKKQTTITEQELETHYKRFEEETKARGASPEKLEELTLRRLQLFMWKELRNPAKKFEGVVVAKSPTTDYGASRQYELAKKKFAENQQEAIAQKLTDQEGNPLYVKSNKAGTRINLEGDVSKTLYLVAKPEGEVEEKRAVLVLRGSKQTSRKVPLYQKVQFRANLSQKSPSDFYLLNGSDVTEFTPTEENALGYKEVMKLLGAHFKENLSYPHDGKDVIVKTNNLDEKFHHMTSIDDKQRFVVLKSDVCNINKTGAHAKSNVVELKDPEGDELPLSCWVDKKDFEINFSVGSMDVVACGRLNRNNENGTFSLELWGIKPQDEDVIKEMPKPVGEDVLNSEPMKEEQW